MYKKANVIFFDAKPASKSVWTKKLRIYDIRTNIHKTLKENSLKREDFAELEELYKPQDRSKRNPTWTEKNPEGHWHVFTYDELIARDKTNLDIFWLKDESLENTENLPAPNILAQEIVEQLEAALEEFRSVEDLLVSGEED